jgi:photosystem II stability/assembly factor-like uncharacterized protein
MKIKYACGLLVGLLLSMALVPYPAQAEPVALKWTKVDKPGTTGNLVVTPSEVSEIAVGQNGVIYTIDSSLAHSKLYLSSDAGVTWEDITSPLLKAGAGLPATRIAVASDDSSTLAVVTDNDTEVYLSTDGGMTWTNTGVPVVVGTIQAIAISNQYTEGNMSLREIAIGTADWGDVAGTTTGQVWVRQFGKLISTWQNQNLVIDPDPSDADPSHPGGEVSALAYSPRYGSDATLLAVASTSSDYVTATYRNKTWLCLLRRDTGVWNSLPNYPVEIGTLASPSAGDGPGVSYIHSSLALPSNYSSSNAASRQLFASYNREPDANDDAYWLNNTTVTRLNADGGNPVDISSIAYHGTLASGTLLAGDVDPVPGSLTVQVRRTLWDSNPLEWEWHTSSVPPTGPGNAKVSWSPDGTIAYCGTGQLPGVAEDESAFSASTDGGDRWRQMGLIDTVIELADIVPAPDSKSLFITTYNEYGPEGIWRSAGSPLGRLWERLLTIDCTTSDNAVILRLSPNYSNDYTMYAAEVGGNQVAVTHDRGNSWRWCRYTPEPIIDMVVKDEDTVYVALPDGRVRESIKKGLAWQSPVDTELADINMLSIAGDGTILVGGKNGHVAYSTDGGASFTRIREIIGSGTGDVQVVADANYAENHTIYAATNIPDEGIWRWVIGVSTQWEQIDRSVTGLGDGQCIGGLAVGSEGTLYALRLEQASGNSGGMTRSLNPLAPDTADIEFDLANQALPAGATFDPTRVNPPLTFPNNLPYLKLSGDSGQNDLWSIDTANQTIYRFQDTLCKLGPTPVIPKAGEVIPTDYSDYLTSLILRWEGLAGATRYQAAIYSDLPATQIVWSQTSTTHGIVATVNNMKLISGTTYYWRVRSLEPLKSPWSETRSFTPALVAGQWSPLAAVTATFPLPGATSVPIRPAFAWQPADHATGYEFVLARDSGFADVVVAMTGASALLTTTWGCDRDLDYATTYFWKVRAITAASYSEWGIGIFTTEAAPAAAPLPPQLSPSPATTTPPPAAAQETPSYPIWMVIGLGVILVVSLLFLIVRTGR